MASQTADQSGQATEQTLAHYKRLAAAEPGLLIVEYSFVHLSGKSETQQLGIHSDSQIEGLSQLARTIQKSGALAGIQITHAGGKTERSLTDGSLMAPSEVIVPVKNRSLEQPNSMQEIEINLWKQAFAAAVDRAVLAGFDLVEFHAAHGYGLNQWLSGITNRRSDIYGCDQIGRTRLLVEIVESARRRHPQLLLSVRIPGQDFMDNGLKLSDSIQIAQTLEKSGVDIIHVSSGIGGWKRPDSRSGEGYLVADAEQIQAQVKHPVIGVGGIETGVFIDESLQTNRLALAAVGRAILKDPSGWREKNMNQNALSRSEGKES